MENTETVNISAYSLLEFCQQAQDLLQQGYKFDFDSNTNCPQQFGVLLVAGLVKEKEQQNRVMHKLAEQLVNEGKMVNEGKSEAQEQEKKTRRTQK